MTSAVPYKKAVILGAAGFIGVNLARALKAEGFDLVCFDRIASPDWPEGAMPVIGDFTDLPARLLHQMDQAIVFHLVSSCLPASDMRRAAEFADRDLTSTIRCLELTKGRRLRWVFVSSGGTVYGPKDDERIEETSPVNPICSYAVIKLAIEGYFGIYGKLHGTDHVIVRPANPYGPGQHPLRGQGIIPALLYKALRNDTLEVWGDGTTVRDYIYIADTVQGLLAAAQDGRSGEIYNIGTGQGLSVNQIIAFIAETLGMQPRISYSAARPVDVRRNVLNATKLSSVTGWDPQTPILSGLELTADWLRQNMASWELATANSAA